MINNGIARTTEGGLYGVDVQEGNNPILLCCNRSIYEDLSGDEKLKVVGDILDVIEIGDYVNGHRVCEINVQGGIIYCDNYNIEIWEHQVEDIVSKERFNSVKFDIARYKARVEELNNQ